MVSAPVTARLNRVGVAMPARGWRQPTAPCRLSKCMLGWSIVVAEAKLNPTRVLLGARALPKRNGLLVRDKNEACIRPAAQASPAAGQTSELVGDYPGGGAQGRSGAPKIYQRLTVPHLTKRSHRVPRDFGRHPSPSDPQRSLGAGCACAFPRWRNACCAQRLAPSQAKAAASGALRAGKRHCERDGRDPMVVVAANSNDIDQVTVLKEDGPPRYNSEKTRRRPIG